MLFIELRWHDFRKLASCIKKQTQDANSLLHRIHMENVEHIARSKEQEAMRNSLQRNEYIGGVPRLRGIYYRGEKLI